MSLMLGLSLSLTGQNGGGQPTIGETVGIVGSRFQVATAVGSIQQNATFRRVHYAHPLAAVTDLQCVDSSWYISDGTLQPTAASARTIKRYIEYPDGVFHQVLWSGAGSKLIDTGSFKSDVVLSSVTGLPLVIAAGAKFAERTVNLNAAVTNFPLIEMPAAHDVLGLEDGGTGTTDVGNSGTISPGTGVNSFGSVAIVGTIAKGQSGAPAKSYILVGDSLIFAQGDISSVGAKGGSGWAGRLLDATGMPYLKIAKKGQGAQQFAGSTGSITALLALIPHSDVICEHGVNDLRLGRTAAQILADQQTIYGLFGSANIFQTTITARTDSASGNYTSVADQTPKTDGNMADLTPLNTSIRAIPANVDAVLDVADAEMSARNSNVHGGPFPPVLDGTHFTSAKAAAIAAALNLNTTPVLPGAVGSLAFTGAGSATLAFSFTAPSVGSNPITYLVEYKRTIDSTWTQFVTGSSALTGTITGLTASTSYDVRVTPSNSGGAGTASTITQSTAATFQPLDLGASLGFAWDTNDTSKVLDTAGALTQMGEKYSSNVLGIGGAPTIITNGGQTGNKRVIDFPAGAYLKGNGFAGLLDIPDGNTATSSFTIVEAGKMLAGVTSRLSFWGTAGSSTLASFSFRATTANRGPSVIEVNSRAAVTAFQTAVETSNYHVFTTIKNGTSVIFRVDGVQVASATLAGDGNWNFNDFYVGTSSGATTPGTPATVFPPDAYSGLVIARTALTGADLTNIEAWVGATAGL
jgi:hypothetical protein